jgi:hypothetical protein
MSTKAEKEANRLRQQKFLEANREEVNAKRRKKYASRIKEGKCPRCGKKQRSKKMTLCKDCLERARDYNAR